MATITKEGFSTGLGFVESVPHSDEADNADKATQATEDDRGQNIYDTYGNFSGDWSKAQGATLTAGTYLIRDKINGEYCYAIIDYEGENGVKYTAFLTDAYVGGNTFFYRAVIQDGTLQVEGRIDSHYTDGYDNSALYYKKITQ